MPVIVETDTPPNQESFKTSIFCLNCGKAPGSDSVLPEVLKNGQIDFFKAFLDGGIEEMVERGLVLSRQRYNSSLA
ncbi:hypothetical protein CHS0354_011400 [Potamilus streckersoni]|uniref:Uncharacterized protein n=1 Tax=Potamilus streckersoni TaxID=2493646 RepID=A0AAE0TG01_9BIVA|nr:hypothetical protein CHS0354_011400 [Potamilus streckersoni]